MGIRRYPRWNRRRTAFKAVCFAVAAATAFLLVDARLRPAINELAKNRATNAAVTAINSAVESELARSAPQYEDIVLISANSSGEITCLSTDIIKMNSLKASVTNAVNSQLSEMAEMCVTVPLGSATGISLITGMGPDLDVKIALNSSTVSTFENEFISAGVNQTRHSVLLCLKTTVMIILPNYREQTVIETSFCVAQTIIVGTVPLVMAE